MNNCQFGCADVDFQDYSLAIDPKYNVKIKMIMISEAFPANSSDYFTGGEAPKYLKNTNHVLGHWDIHLCLLKII